MKVVGHDCVGADIYGEDGRERFNPVQDPLFTVVKVLSGGPIKTKEEGAANAARSAMVVRSGLGIHQPITRLSHGFFLERQSYNFSYR
ncbi:MAG: hypothetical protein WDZ52_06975 [Pseudohongiellaceae bacterium]